MAAGSYWVMTMAGGSPLGSSVEADNLKGVAAADRIEGAGFCLFKGLRQAAATEAVCPPSAKRAPSRSARRRR